MSGDNHSRGRETRRPPYGAVAAAPRAEEGAAVGSVEAPPYSATTTSHPRRRRGPGGWSPRDRLRPDPPPCRHHATNRPANFLAWRNVVAGRPGGRGLG